MHTGMCDIGVEKNVSIHYDSLTIEMHGSNQILHNMLWNILPLMLQCYKKLQKCLAWGIPPLYMVIEVKIKLIWEQNSPLPGTGMEKMSPEKMSPLKMAPSKKGTRKKWHYVNLGKMSPYLFYGLQPVIKLLIQESMFECLLIAIYFKHTQL